jgi:hypothetical protein
MALLFRLFVLCNVERKVNRPLSLLGLDRIARLIIVYKSKCRFLIHIECDRVKPGDGEQNRP